MRTRGGLRRVVALALVAALLPLRGDSCTCQPPAPYQERFGNATHVFDAFVLYKVSLKSPKPEGNKWQYFVRAKRDAYKGCLKHGDLAVIESPESTALCGVDLKRGGSYILTLRSDAGETCCPGTIKTLTLASCDLPIPTSSRTQEMRSVYHHNAACCECTGTCTCANGRQPDSKGLCPVICPFQGQILEEGQHEMQFQSGCGYNCTCMGSGSMSCQKVKCARRCKSPLSGARVAVGVVELHGCSECACVEDPVTTYASWDCGQPFQDCVNGCMPGEEFDVCAGCDECGAECPEECRPACTCKPGLKRLNRQCIPAAQCPTPTPCPANETFSVCGTCDGCNMAVCTAECKVGCFCKPGFRRNSLGDCVAQSACEAPCGEHEMAAPCSGCDLCNELVCVPNCTATAMSCVCERGYARKGADRPCELRSSCPV